MHSGVCPVGITRAVRGGVGVGREYCECEREGPQAPGLHGPRAPRPPKRSHLQMAQWDPASPRGCPPRVQPAQPQASTQTSGDWFR